MKLKTLRGQTVTYTIYVHYMLMVGLIMGTLGWAILIV